MCKWTTNTQISFRLGHLFYWDVCLTHIEKYLYVYSGWFVNALEPLAERCRWIMICLTHLTLKNGRRLIDDIFRCICMYEKLCISIRLSLRFVPRDPISNKPVFVQVMAWRRTDDKTLPKLMLTKFTNAYIRPSSPTHTYDSRGGGGGGGIVALAKTCVEIGLRCVKSLCILRNIEINRLHSLDLFHV